MRESRPQKVCPPLTEGVLCLDGAVCEERLGLSLVGDGRHPELVHLALLQIVDVEGQRTLVAGNFADLKRKERKMKVDRKYQRYFFLFFYSCTNFLQIKYGYGAEIAFPINCISP